MMAMGWTAGIITGLYREDAVNNASAAAFSKTSDVFREVQPALNISTNDDDSWLERVRSSDSNITI